MVVDCFCGSDESWKLTLFHMLVSSLQGCLRSAVGMSHTGSTFTETVRELQMLTDEKARIYPENVVNKFNLCVPEDFGKN